VPCHNNVDWMAAKRKAEIAKYQAMFSTESDKETPDKSRMFEAGTGLLQLEQYKEAADVFQMLASEGYQTQASLLCAAQCLAHLGFFVGARANLDECLAIDPDWPEARKFEAELNRRTRSEALKSVLLGLTLAAVCGAVYFVLGKRNASSSSRSKRP